MSTDRDALLPALAQDPSGFSIGFAGRGLPPGHVVDVPGAGPLYWVSEGAPSAVDVVRARARAAVTGLWPLLVEGGGTWMVNCGRGEPEQVAYWLGEGRPSDASRIDPDRWLAEQWQELIAENESDFEPEDRVSGHAPHGETWPGLAPAATPDLDADLCANTMTTTLLGDDWLTEPRMVLVPATAGSEALTAARCTLAENDDLAGHAAVVHSWEHRFGARVIAMRRDTLFVSVAAPPKQRSAAVHIACEHFAFAPDNIEQNADSFPEYVDDLIGNRLWGFWWD